MKVVTLASILLVPVVVQGDWTTVETKVTPDWDKLTDFTTSFSFDAQPIIADTRVSRGHNNFFGFAKFQESGKIQLDYLGERVKFSIDDWSVQYSHENEVPPPLRGVSGTGKAEMTFDAKAGTVGLRESAKMNTPAGPVAIEMCVTVNFPQGLMPPKQFLAAKLDQQKPQIDSRLAQLPNMKTTVDGNTVAVYREFPLLDGTGWSYFGIQQDATPVGVGMSPPSGGKWSDAVLKFSDWTKGAGSIVTEGCGVHMSATELLASPHSNRIFLMVDQLMERLQKTEPLSAALAHFPQQPSSIFVSAAALEGEVSTAMVANVDGNVQAPSWSWAMVTAAAAAGATSAAVVLAVFESRRRVRNDAYVAMSA